MKPKGTYEYSIWIMASGRTARAAQRTIRGLARANGTVSFRPHVTLLGYISGERAEIIRKASRLSSRIRKIPVRLSGVSHSGSYTMPLFVKVGKTRELVAARKHAEKEFASAKSRFAPHMSLMYARLPKSRRIKMLGDIKKASLGEGFIAHTICLYARRWDGKKWAIVKSFRLS